MSSPGPPSSCSLMLLPISTSFPSKPCILELSVSKDVSLSASCVPSSNLISGAGIFSQAYLGLIHIDGFVCKQA
jgi:hypothetical protein